MTRSILPNSSPEILRERYGCNGILQVVWIEEINAHALFFTDSRGRSLLATHHNGHSCASLAERMLSGDLKRAEDQRAYIVACGGTAKGPSFIADIMGKEDDA